MAKWYVDADDEAVSPEQAAEAVALLRHLFHDCQAEGVSGDCATLRITIVAALLNEIQTWCDIVEQEAA